LPSSGTSRSVHQPCTGRSAASWRRARLRPPDERAGRSPANVFMFVDVNRPWRHAKVTDQPVDAFRGGALRDIRRHGSASHPAPAGDSLHPEARELAQHGRDRDRRDGVAMPRSAHSERGDAREGSEGLGAPPQPRQVPDQLAFQVDRARQKLGRASCASWFALIAAGPTIRCTIFDLNDSLYSLTLGSFPVPCYDARSSVPR
jgi:hypothetical protein